MTPTPSLPLTGACGCGAVRFEISEPLPAAAYCHCTRCQRRTGTAVQASARIAPCSLRLTAGEENLRAWSPGGGLDKVFCGEGGPALSGRDPGHHQFVAYTAPWEPISADGLSRFDERIPG